MNSGLLVFDGVCVLCTAWLRFVLKHDHRRTFKFVTMQSPAGRKLMEIHGLDPDDPVSFLVIADGVAFNDSSAVFRVVSEFGGAWQAIKILRIVPRFIRDPIYRFFARHRYRIFGKLDSCMVPDAQILDRFVHDVEDLDEQYAA